jgi:hypothetical protein
MIRILIFSIVGLNTAFAQGVLTRMSPAGFGTNSGAEVKNNQVPFYNPDLYEIEGQSNAAGNAASSDLPSDLIGPMSKVNIFNPFNCRWEQLVPGGNSRGTINISGTGAADGMTIQYGVEGRLMQLIRDNSPTTSKYLLKYCISNSYLAADVNLDWNTTSTTEWYYKSNRNMIQATASQGDKRPPRVIIWIQGENDCGDATSAGNYQTHLENYISGKRAQYGYSIPFVIVRLGSLQSGLNSTNKATIVSAQNTVASQTDNYIVDADGLATSDGVHYTAASYDTLANRIFSALTANNLTN